MSISKALFFSALDDESLNGPVPSMGRITGSASIETLVRVGIEKENGLGPESKMVVLHDFTPCVDDELEVKRGQIVHVLYQENDWVYVISESNHEGFIPHSYCAQYGSQLAGLALNVKKKLPRDPNQQQTVLPPPASGGSSNSGGSKVPPQRFGGSNPPPDVLNPANAMMHKNENDPNMTMATTVTSASMGRGNTPSPESLNVTHRGSLFLSVNAGMEQSDTDSFHDNNVRNHFPVSSRGGHHSQQQPLDPSRSNSLMSETSSQPDIHPFFKVSPNRIEIVRWLISIMHFFVTGSLWTVCGAVFVRGSR